MKNRKRNRAKGQGKMCVVEVGVVVSKGGEGIDGGGHI